MRRALHAGVDLRVVRGRRGHHVPRDLDQTRPQPPIHDVEANGSAAAVHSREPARLAPVLDEHERSLDETRHHSPVPEHHVDPVVAVAAVQHEQAVLTPHKRGEPGVADRVDHGGHGAADERRGHGRVPRELEADGLGEREAEHAGKRDGDTEHASKGEEHVTPAVTSRGTPDVLS